MARGSNNSFLVGFLIGFFGGCLGVMVAFLIDRDWGVPALMGMAVSIGSSLLLIVPLMTIGVMTDTMSAPIAEIQSVNADGSPTTATVPWGLILAAMGGGVIAAAGVVGAFIMYNQSGDDQPQRVAQAQIPAPAPAPPPPPFPGSGGGSSGGSGGNEPTGGGGPTSGGDGAGGGGGAGGDDGGYVSFDR